MVLTRSRGGQSTSNATAHAQRPAQKGTVKRTGQAPRKRVRMAVSDSEAAEEPLAIYDTTKPSLEVQFLNLPVEIFGEICSFLDAIDLRHLSLTCATFWSVLVSAKSDIIWRQAFGRAVPPMPECPETMSGPEYARFMLVESCTACGKNPGLGKLSFDYFHRVQFCDSCYRANIVSQIVVRRLYPDLPLDFLKYLSSHSVGSDDASLARFRGIWQGSQRLYHKATMQEVYKLWKSLSDTGDTPSTALIRLTERLQKYAENRIQSGLKMNDWQIAVSLRKQRHLHELVLTRRISILARLLQLGHQEADFPRRHREVIKAEALTEEEWDRIRPILESATETNRLRRIQNQALSRRNRRSRDLTWLWRGVVTVASGARNAYWNEMGICADFNEFLDFQPVAVLMAADTDGVSVAEINSIRPEALQFAIQGRRQRLAKLHNILKGLPVDHVDEEEWSSLSDQEIIAKLDTTAAELVLAVSGFWDSKRKVVEWYPSPKVVGGQADLSGVSSVEVLAPGLTAKILAAIGKGANAEASALISLPWNAQTVYYRCVRCDQRVAPYLNFQELIAHFLERRVWFDQASLARESAIAGASSSGEPTTHPTFFDDHDWHADGDLIALDDSHEKARVTKLQNQLEVDYGNDPEDYDGEDFTTRSRRSTNQAPQRRRHRICRLCPEGFSPKPMYLATLKVHIENIHCKEVNVEQDTAVFDPTRDTLPETPCVFDVPFISL